jgi:hypothetical protein
MRCLQSTSGMWGLCEQKYFHNPAREKGWKPNMYPYYIIKRRVNVCSTERDLLMWGGSLASQHLRIVTSSASSHFRSVCDWTKAQGLILFALFFWTHIYSCSGQQTQWHTSYITHSAYCSQNIYNSWRQDVEIFSKNIAVLQNITCIS